MKAAKFTHHMRPALSEYYRDKISSLQAAVAETIPEEITAEVMHTALGDDTAPLTPDMLNEPVYHPMRQYLKVRGKLFRPLICGIFLEAYGKEPEAYKPVLAMAEIIHSSSLILDDIADASLLRRGEPCSHLIYGIPRAANASTAMTFYVFKLIQSLPLLDTATRLKLYDMLLWEHYITGIGSALDLGWAKNGVMDIPDDQYIQHILFRSCSYTYRHAARLGAIVAGVDDSDMQIIVRYSSLLGVAFQFMDDIFNLKPESEGWGKTIGEDITEGKRSPLVLHALKKALPADRQRLLTILQSSVTDAKTINECITLLEKYNSFTVVKSGATAYIAEACMLVDQLHITEEYRQLLREFAWYVVERKV